MDNYDLIATQRFIKFLRKLHEEDVDSFAGMEEKFKLGKNTIRNLVNQDINNIRRYVSITMMVNARKFYSANPLYFMKLQENVLVTSRSVDMVSEPQAELVLASETKDKYIKLLETTLEDRDKEISTLQAQLTKCLGTKTGRNKLKK